MNELSKIFKIKIGDKSLSVTLDGSFLAENIYKNANYEPKINGLHYHALYELFIIKDEGLTLFSENSEQTYKNCILIIPPFFKHYATRSNDHRIMISYKGENRQDTPLTLKTNQNVNYYAEKIKENLFKQGNINNEITECFLKLIFCEIATENNISRLESYTPKNESYFEKIEKILLDFGNDIKLEDVAKQLNLSKKQTARIIRKSYNTTFAEMLRERRLSAAAALLTNSDLSVSEIVERVNFPTESYFYNKFKEAYSKTPLNYRKENRHQN